MDSNINQSGFSRFNELVARHIFELEQANPLPGSGERRLLNHLQALKSDSLASSSATEVANNVKGLAHFAVDSMEWRSQLSDRVEEILSFYAALFKAENRK
jgi:hypothetical protein